MENILIGIIVISITAIPLLITLKPYIIDDDSEVQVSKVTSKKRKGKSAKRRRSDIEKRIESILLKTDESVSKKLRTYNALNKPAPISIRIKKTFIKTLKNEAMNLSILDYFIVSTLLAVVLAVYGLTSYGILVGTALGTLGLITPYTFVNIIGLRKKVVIAKDILNALTIHYGNYLEAPNFEIATIKTVKGLTPGTKPYNVFSKFLDKVQKINMNKVDAMEQIKAEMGNIPHVNTYIDISIKAETQNPDYRKSLGGIPEDYELTVKQQEDFTLAAFILFSVYIAIGAAMILMTLFNKITGNQSYVAVLSNPLGKNMYIVAFIIYALAGIMMVFASSEIKAKRWS